MNQPSRPLVWLVTCGGWYLAETARALLQREALAELWLSAKNSTALPTKKFRRCWPFHILMKPYFHLAPQIWTERAFYRFFPIWRAWIRHTPPPRCNVAQAIMGYATEVFDQAEKQGALKVVDCQNSHPTSYYGYWQRECDIWHPGYRVPIPQWMFSRMNQELERADMILCPSDFVRDTMISNGVPRKKCFVNPFGADTRVFLPRAQLPPVPRFVCVGTICLRKGHQYLFRAFQQVKVNLPNAELVCIGEYKDDFACDSRRWQGTFTHIRRLPHAELAAFFKTCSAFVLASVEEGFARVISEGMAAGLPIIATYESGAATEVTSGVEGIIVPARQPDALAAAMITAANDSVLNVKMGRAAHSRVHSQNSWQDYGDRLLKEYESRLVSR